MRQFWTELNCGHDIGACCDGNLRTSWWMKDMKEDIKWKEVF